MEARMVYPTAPFDAQAQHPNIDVPPARTGESVESPGKTMGVLSKVKNKAKKLRNKIKKVRGSKTAATGHGDNVNEHGTRDFDGTPSSDSKDFDDDEGESNEDEEEEDLHKSNKNEFRYEQLRSIGALDDQGDGSEVEVCGGVPVPATGDKAGSFWKRSDDSEPMSAYKSAGPPGALQATPTEYRNYAADDDASLGGVPANRERDIGAPLEESGRSGKNFSAMPEREFKPDTDASSQSFEDPAKPHPKQGVSGVSLSDTDVANPASLASSNPSAEESSAPVHDKIAVTDEDLFADRKLGVGLPSDKHDSSSRGSALETLEPEVEPDERKRLNLFDAESGESQSKYGVLGTGGTPTPDVNEPYPEDLVKPNPAFGQSSSPTHGKIAVVNRDVSPDENFGLGLPSGEHSGSGRENLLETSVPEGEELTGHGKGNALETLDPEVEPEGERLKLPDSEVGESQSKYGALSTGATSASDIDVPYPGDLVKPNPSFGQSSSPTHGKIAVVNKDASPDEKVGLGPSSGDFSGSGKGSLLETSVPESEELTGFHEGGSGLPLEADELVYRPVSDSEEGSSLTSPPGKLEGAMYERNAGLQGSGTESPFQDHNTRQSEELSEDPAASEVDTTTKNHSEDDPANYDEQKQRLDVASDRSADKEIDTAGDDGHENWGKWSADKISSAGGVIVSSLVANDLRNDGETQGSSESKSKDATETNEQIPDKAPELDSIDAAKLPAGKDVNQESEEDYYDPNEVKDDQFEQGFSLGNAEEDALSGTLAGSAIETLQGLKDSFQSSLGYSNPDHSDAGGEDRSGSVEGNERAFSPSSSQQQRKGGFVEGLRQSVTSSLGYGKATPEDEADQDTQSLERGVERHIGSDSSQQQPGGAEEADEGAQSSSSSRMLSPSNSQKQQKGGFFQGLKQTVASSLGYGEANPVEEGSQNTDDLIIGRDSESDLDSRQRQLDGAEEVKESGLSPSTSQKQQKGGFVHGVEESVDSSLAYGEAASDKDGHTNDISDKGGVAEADLDSKQQAPAGTYQALKNVFASKLGYGAGAESGKQTPTESSEPPAELERRELSPDEGSEIDQESSQQQADGVEEVKGRGLSPGIFQEQEKGGFGQQLNDAAESPLGFGEAASEKVGNSNDVPDSEGVSGIDVDGKQQQPTGTYQALKNVFASKLGYSVGAGSEKQLPTSIKENESPEFSAELERDESPQGESKETDSDSRQGQLDGVEEVKERGLSPSISQEEQGGFVKGLKDSIDSPLGYAEAASDEAGDSNDVPEQGGGSETGLDSKQPQPTGTYQALKNVFASKLGYGAGADSGKQSPSTTKETESREVLAEPERHESPRGEESETDLDSSERQLDGVEEVKERGLSPGISQEMQKGGFVEGVKESAESSSTYGEAASDKDGRINDVLEKGGGAEGDTDSQQQQPAGTYQALKNVFASKLGYGPGAASGKKSPTESSELPEELGRHEKSPGEEGEAEQERRQQQLDGEEEVKERDLSSRSSQEHQMGGLFQELKEAGESSPGYGEAASEKAGDSNDVPEKGEVSETDLDGRQQQPTGTYQALKNVFASKLGYGAGAGSGKESPSRELPLDLDLEKHESPNDEEGEVDLNSRQQQLDGVGEGKERGLSPSSSHEQQKGGFVEGAKESVESAFGYGEAAPSKGDDSNDVLEKGSVSETDSDSRQQQPTGTYQGLKNVFASKLGYGSGSAEQSPMSKEAETHESSAEVERHESARDDKGESNESGAKQVLGLNDVKNDAGRADEAPELSPRSPGVLQGWKDRITSTLGYNSQSAEPQ